MDRAFVLTGGWQADRERAYVALTRARERTDIYVSREDLGEQGMDAGAVERLGEAIATSTAEPASITTPEHRDPPQMSAEPPLKHDRSVEQSDAVRDRESQAARAIRESQLEHDHDREFGWSID